MIYYWRRYKKYIAIIWAILLIICGIIYKNTVYDTQIVISEEKNTSVDINKTTEEEKKIIEYITVYVCGSVKSPSNVTLLAGSRVEDAIKLAGGYTDNADLNGINMAQRLSDADMIYVPKKGEVMSGENVSSKGSISAKTKSKININKANVSELDTLPGIGPSTADKIIEYRNSIGGFKSIEDLNNVSGIGDKKFNDIKALITVD